MKRMKIFTLIIGLLTALGAAAQNSGNAGPLTWNYNAGTKTLSITGTGAMPDYASMANQPWDAFGEEIETVTIGNGVTSVGKSAFQGCAKLQNATIGNSVQTIGGFAFMGCKKLRAITLPDALTTIKNNAFYECKALQSITIPANVNTIGSNVFSHCTDLTAFNVAAGNPHFDSDGGVLYNEGKTELIQYPSGKPDVAFTVPGTVNTMGEDAFNFCVALKSITIPAGVSTISHRTFFYCHSLTDINVVAGNPHFDSEDGVLYNEGRTKLIYYPLAKTGTDFTIPGTVTTIGRLAFFRCSELRNISIPNSVNTMEGQAFTGESLQEITVAWDTPLSIGPDVFSYVTLSNVTLKVPAGKVAAYEAADVWKNIGTITDGTTTIGLSATPTKLDFTAAEESKSISVSSDRAWTVSSNQGWLTLSPSSGTGNGTLTVTAKENPGAPRIATITFTAGARKQTVSVEQEEMSLEINPPALNFTAADDTKSITVTSNGTWQVESDQTWLTLSVDNGTGNSSVNATATANPGSTTRTAKVIFTSVAGIREVDVTQEGASLSVTPVSLDFTADGEGKTITVTANVPWTVTSSEPSWLTLSDDSGTGNTTLTVTAAVNPAITNRTATVTFTQNGGTLMQTVNVTQQAAPPMLSVTPDELVFTAVKGKKKLTVTSNVQWTVTSSEPWLTLSAASGTGDSTFTVTAAMNPAITNRTATVTFKQNGGTLTKTVTVTQAAASLEVVPSTLSFTAAGENKALLVKATQSWTAECDAPWITLSAASGTGDGTITVTAPA
ncbi:BACON domain-containing protein, partial [Tannerella forsythia]